jgi:hypothetical protein
MKTVLNDSKVGTTWTLRYCMKARLSSEADSERRLKQEEIHEQVNKNMNSTPSVRIHSIATIVVLRYFIAFLYSLSQSSAAMQVGGEFGSDLSEIDLKVECGRWPFIIPGSAAHGRTRITDVDRTHRPICCKI